MLLECSDSLYSETSKHCLMTEATLPKAFNLIACRYHAVGQGLFTSGALVKQGHIGPRFRWVYDCGTSSEQQLIADQINEMPWLRGRHDSRLDLVTISHFDADHISGLVRLVGRFPIGTLLLPYASLAARLIAAFEQGVSPASPVFRLFVDPVGYIRAQDGGERIGRIVLVPPSNGDGAPPPPDDDVGPPDTEGEAGELMLRIDADEINASAATELMIGDQSGAGIVEMLRQGGRLWLDGLWEFVPYNNAELAPSDLDGFREEVRSRRDALLTIAEAWRKGTDPKDKDRNEAAALRAVEDLKRYYDVEIGPDSKARNLISLFLYSGPLFTLPYAGNIYGHAYSYRRGHSWYGLDRLAQLFSGDGYLNNDQRFSDLEKHFSRRRLDRVGIFQVMHHGARGNWQKGVAAKLKPRISVFSSDPNRGNTYHPHAEVLRDFWSFGAIQVDDSSSLDVTMDLEP